MNGINLLDGGTPQAPVQVDIPAQVDVAIDAAPIAPVAPVIDIPPAPVIPAAAPEITSDQINEYLRTNVGLTIDEVTTLKSRPSFANDLAKNINELILQQKSPDEIIGYVKLQGLNPSAMADDTAIKTELQVRYPSLSQSDIDTHFDKNYGEPESRDRVKMSIDAANAKAWLQQQKADQTIIPQTPPTPQVQAPTQDPAALAQLEVQKQQWLAITPNVLDPKITLSTTVEGMGEYSIDVIVDQAASAPLTQMVINNMINQGSPLNQDTMNQAKSFARDMYIVQNFKSILAAVIKDSSSEIIKQMSGSPVGRVQPGVPPPAAQQRQVSMIQ
jgi:hypothetical protein